jgi:hypothetical protein
MKMKLHGGLLAQRTAVGRRRAGVDVVTPVMTCGHNPAAVADLLQVYSSCSYCSEAFVMIMYRWV